MTVKQLISKLKNYPEDAEVVVFNDDCYISGTYRATDVEEYIDSTVALVSDYKDRLD